MTEPTSHCPDCGTALPADSPQALCPACLMKQALASRTIVDGGRTPVAPPLSPEELAEKFPGFEILECLGRGGMGVVYKARQKSLGRLVAIKILPPERVGEARFADRFAIEAATLAKLNHPNIVTVHDFGVSDSQPSSPDSQPLYYIVMEYVDGVNLRDLLREGKLEAKQALAIVPPICDALQYAHDKGIVHRDIKPENLLLDKNGRVKIADFGIAKLIEPVAAVCDRRSSPEIDRLRSQTAATVLAGTPDYAAPEQASGIADHRADIYALGVVLYEMLTGQRPDKELIAPSRKVRIDVRLDEMVLRALEKEPERRYQTAEEFRTMVQTIYSSPPPMQSVAVVPTEKPPGMFARWWWVFPLMVPVSVVLALVAGAVFNYVTPKKYEASAIVEYKPTEQAEMPIHSIGSIFAELKSEARLSLVSKKLDLPNRWMVDESVALQILKATIILQNIRGTDLIEIRVKHTSPQDAMDVVNAMLEVASTDPQARVFYHEMPVFPQRPVSPNLALTLVSAGALGLFASPLLGWILATLLHRFFPVKPAAGSGAGSAARVHGTSNQQAPTLLEKTPVELAEDPFGKGKKRRKKFSFRLHDRTPSKAALLGIAVLCLFVGCLLPVVGEPLWRLFTSEGSMNEAASIPSSAAAGLPVWIWGLGLGLLLVFVTMVFSLVLVFRSNGSGPSKFLAAFLLVLLFGGTMAALVGAAIFGGFAHQRDVSREIMRHEMLRSISR